MKLLKEDLNDYAEFNVLVVDTDYEADLYSYTHNSKADARLAELADMSDDELLEKGILAYAQVDPDDKVVDMYISSKADYDKARRALNGEDINEALKEDLNDISRNDRLNALCSYLDVKPNYFEEESYDENAFSSKEYNEEYLVLTEEEAYDYAVQDIKDVYDDLGIESFTPNFQKWILENAVGDAWFTESFDEMNQGYVDDIENESDNVFENRLISELVDENILTEKDFDNWGEDNPVLKDSVDLDEKKREYVERLAPEDPIQEYKFEFGEDEFKKAVDQAGIDLDAVADEAISLDGVAHFIARYDGDEIDLGNGLFAYRTN